LVNNKVTRDMEKWNKFVNEVTERIASAGVHKSVGIDERSRQYQ
jgi:hypothetical protein